MASNQRYYIGQPSIFWSNSKQNGQKTQNTEEERLVFRKNSQKMQTYINPY